jgi:O-antigen/teichoic acid export membrane protein
MPSVSPRPQTPAAERPDESLVASRTAGPAAIRGSVLRGAGYAATILLSLVSAPLLIRHLGIAAFGRYTAVISIVTIIGGLADAGLLNIALREWVTRRGADRDQLARSLVGIRLELSTAGVALGVGFAALAGYDSVLVIGTLIAGFGMVLQALAHLLSVPLQADLRFGWTSAIDVARQFVSVVLIVVLVVIGATLLPFFAVTIPAGLAMLLVAALLVRGKMPLSPQFRGMAWWPLVRGTLPYAAAVAVNTVYFRVTIVVMSLIASSQQTGYFATSFRVTEVLVGIPAFAVGAAFPILSHAAATDRPRFTQATERILELALMAGTAMALLVVLSAPFVIEVLAGTRGAPATPVLQIQGLALIATFLATAAAYPLLALRRHAALLIANGAALVMNVVLTLVLVPLDRARGAAIAAVIAESCLAISQLVLLVRSRQAQLPLRSVPAVALAGAAGAAPLLLDIPPLLRTLAGSAIFIAVIAMLGLFPPELRHLLGRGRHQ